MKTDKNNGNGSVSKILDILESFSNDNQEKRIADIASELDISYPTAHRLIKYLVNRGYLFRDATYKTISLGAKIYFLGKIASKSINLINLAFPIMQELSEISGETVNLYMRDGHYRVCYEQCESLKALKHSAPIGVKLPLWAGASGKCFLAFDSGLDTDEVLKEIVPMTANTITDSAAFKEEIKRIRERGYAASMSEREEGVASIAAPVVNYAGHMVACVTISGPEFRIKEIMEQRYFDLLVNAARRISEELGFFKNRRK